MPGEDEPPVRHQFQIGAVMGDLAVAVAHQYAKGAANARVIGDIRLGAAFAHHHEPRQHPRIEPGVIDAGGGGEQGPRHCHGQV